MFLIDKYNPHSVDELIYHKDIAHRLQIISNDISLPNIIIYGASKVGKKTLVSLFLEMIFDKSVHKMNKTKYVTVGSNGVSTDIDILQSNYHILIEPNNNNSDRYIIQDIIKEYVSKTPLNFFKTKKPFKVILINDVHKLSYYAQTSLRRTMELYAKTCRFILISSSLSQVIEPLKSRCFMVRVPAPSTSDIYKLLIKVSMDEKINVELNDLVAIQKECNNNVNDCLWMLDNIKHFSHTKNNGTSYLNNKINILCMYILRGNINDLVNIRNIIYSFIVTTINDSDIIKLILNNLLDKISTNYHKYLIIKSASLYEYRTIIGRHLITHIEGFIVDIFTILFSSDRKFETHEEINMDFDEDI